MILAIRLVLAVILTQFWHKVILTSEPSNGRKLDLLCDRYFAERSASAVLESSSSSSWYLDFSYHGLFVPSLDDSYRDARLTNINVSYQNVLVFSVSQTPWIWLTFSPNGWDFLVQILLSDYTFLSTLDYKVLFNCLQLWQSCAILSVTTVICSKCPPSAKTHAGWSHLISYKFVKIGDNWIKICNLP